MIRDAVFSSQGDLMATVGDETGVSVYNTSNMQLLHRLNASEKILAVTISDDGQSIATSSDTGAVWLWNVQTQSLLHRLEGHQKPTVRTSFSSDGKLLATASSSEQQVFLWDIATGRRIGDLPIAQDVMALTFSPDNKTLAVAGFEHLATLWDVASLSQLGTLRGHVGAIRAVTYSPDGQTLVTAGDDGTARLWHVPTRQELGVLIRRSTPLQWIRFLSSGQLVIGTSAYGSGSQRGNDVLVFDTGELSPNNRDSISFDAADSGRITKEL
jgi:WD40 repeat protein